MRTLIFAAVTALLLSSSIVQAAPPPNVWVNTDSKTYHCPNTQYYGKTKSGEYMTEAQAKAKGNKPASDKACS